MQTQQDGFDTQMAKAVLAASDQRTAFDSQMAKADSEARSMQTAYDRLACDNAEQKETAARVSFVKFLDVPYVGGLLKAWFSILTNIEFLQNEANAKRVKISKMQTQQDGFDTQMAKAVLAASDQRTLFDNQMAKAELAASDQRIAFDNRMAEADLEARGMRSAYNKLTSDNAVQKETAARVSLGSSQV